MLIQSKKGKKKKHIQDFCFATFEQNLVGTIESARISTHKEIESDETSNIFS